MGQGFVRLKVLSDGSRDFIEVPPGTRYTLGYVSAAKAVVALAANTHEARAALNSFLSKGLGTFMGDPQRLAMLFDGGRPVLAKALIPAGDRIPSARERTTMASEQIHAVLTQRIDKIENQIKRIASQASAGRVLDGEIKAPRALVGTLSEPIVDAAVPAPPAAPSPEEVAKVAAVNDNVQVASKVLRTVEATNDKIDRLVEAGKQFNSVRAKADLHKIASQISEIVSNVDLSADWVRNDLLSLSKRADEIHGLFPKDL